MRNIRRLSYYSLTIIHYVSFMDRIRNPSCVLHICSINRPRNILATCLWTNAVSKPANRPYSRYSQDAAILLGQIIRRARIERKITATELAERAGISRGLVQRIEKGDPGCAIGAAFEVAAIVGVRLFGADQAALSGALSANTAILTLLPKSVRASRIEAKDDF